MVAFLLIFSSYLSCGERSNVSGVEISMFLIIKMSPPQTGLLNLLAV